MNSYLFSAGYTTTQVVPTPGRGGQMVDELQTWDGCTSAVIYSPDAELAQKRFEQWLTPASDAERPAEVQIRKIVAAQFVDQLFTESGGRPLDWQFVARQMADQLQQSAEDEFAQGYWVDINQTLPPGNISSDLESLAGELSENTRSGLNWSPDKQFFFLVSILSPLPMPGLLVNAPDTPAATSDLDAGATEPDAEAELDVYLTALPELRDKEAAALVLARNSVVAAWVWRKYAANTRLAANELHLAPCCAVIHNELEESEATQG